MSALLIAVQADSGALESNAMTKAMKMLEDLRRCASYRDEYPGNDMPTIFGLPMDVYIGDVIGLLKEENASIERIVRDAICSYQESFPSAPNDDCERELIERAEKANKWLVDHDFEIEPLLWSKEEPPCL